MELRQFRAKTIWEWLFFNQCGRLEEHTVCIDLFGSA